MGDAGLEEEKQRLRLGVVTSDDAGWKSVRKRWEDDLVGYRPILRHLEDHARILKAITDWRGPRSVGAALEGRAAAQSALREGVNVILLTTLQNAAFVPLPKGVLYLVYGDCTDSQLVRLYNGKEPHFPGSLIGRCVGRLARRGCYFLCASEWYREALRCEHAISEDRLIFLPHYVDTQLWRPLENKVPGKRKQVLFIGGDFQRKGGDILYDLAALEPFRNVDFHVVSPNAEPGPDNVHVHRSLTAECAGLIELTRNCDVLVLPTRADVSSLAALEAAACGVPAIITNRGGIPEIVIDGHSGRVLPEPLLQPFAEALAAFLANKDLVAAYGRNARAHVQRSYSKSRHFGILREVIARAAGVS